MAMEYVGLGNDEKAKEILEELVAREPEYSATYYHLGKLYERAGDKDSAIDIYTRGIQITRAKKEQHALSELMSAKNEVENEDW